MLTTEELIEKVLDATGGDIESALNVLCDGAYLGALDVDQETVEVAYNTLKYGE